MSGGSAGVMLNGERSKGRRILVVDDHVEIRESLGDLLEAAGYSVACVDGGASALDYLNNHQEHAAPDVILLDFLMHDMTGADFLAKRAVMPLIARIPVVMVTADARGCAMALGLDLRCLRKPVEFDELLAAIELVP